MENENEFQGLEKPEGEQPQAPAPQPAAQMVVKPPEVQEAFGRAKRAEEALKRVNEELAAYKAKEASAVPEDFRRELALTKLMTKGYSEDEAQLILKIGDENNPVLKAGFEAQRAKAKVEQAQAPASQVSSPPKEAQPIHKLPATERARAWQDALARSAGKRSGQAI